jgi:hypothetical protein
LRRLALPRAARVTEAQSAMRVGSGLPWWTHPGWLVLLYVIPLYVFIYFVPALFGPSVIRLKFLDYFTIDYFLLGLTFLLIFANGALLGGSTWGRLAQTPRPMWIHQRFMDFVAITAILAYLIWFHRIFIDPEAWLALLRIGGGSISLGRQKNPTIGVITTAAQFAIAYTTLYLLVRLGNPSERIPRRFLVYFVTLLFLTGFRVIAWAERLALIEIVIPLVIVSILYRRPAFIFKWRILIVIAPFLGIVSLLLYFAGTEYLRSWTQYYHQKESSFWGFSVSRLATYYYTALNNGAGLLKHYEWPTWNLGTLLGWLYRFPILGFVIQMAKGSRGGPGTYLTRFGDVEFNNMSGIFPVFHDLGVAGALVLAFVWGAVMGYLYRTFRYQNGIGLLLFPITYISLLEVLRIFYITTSRAFPAIFVVLIAYVLFIRRRNPKSGNADLSQHYLRLC